MTGPSPAPTDPASGPPAHGDALSPRVLLFIAVAIAVVVGIGTAAFLFTRIDEAHHETLVELQSISEAKARQISIWYEERNADAAVLSATPVALATLQQVMRDGTVAGDPVRTWLETLHDRYRYHSLGLYAPDGRLVAAVPDAHFDADRDEVLAGVATAFASRRVHLDPLSRSSGDGHLTLRFFVPLVPRAEPGAEPLAVLLLDAMPDVSARSALEWWPSASASAETVLVRRHDASAHLLFASRDVATSARDIEVAIAPGSRLLAVRAVLGELGALEGLDYRGERVLGFATRIPGTDWIIVAKVDAREADAVAWTEAAMAGSIALASLMALAFGLTMVWYRRGLDAAERELGLVRQREAAAEGMLVAQQRLARAVDAISESVWEHDLVGGQQHYSPRWKRMLGYAEDEIDDSDAAWRALVHPDDLPRVDAAFREHLETNAPYDVEYRLRHKDGTWRWVHARGRAARDAEGRPTLMTGATSDITERRQKDERLRDSEQLFGAVFRSVPVGLAVSGQADGRFVLVNAVFARELGYDSTDLVGRSSLELGMWPDVTQRQRMVAAASSGKGYRDMEVALRRKDGSIGTFLLNGTRVEIGGREYLLSSLTDVTQRLAQSKALVESEARYARAIRGTSDGLWDWGLQDGSHTVSPRWLELLGYREDELPRGTDMFMTLVHPEDRPRLEAAAAAHFEREVPYDLEIRLRHRDGGYRWFRTRGQAERDANGQPLRMSGTISDISEQKALLAEREELQRQIQHAQRMESMGRLAGGVAHDYNNMLAVIVGTVDLALDQMGPDDPLRADLETIQAAAKRSVELTRQLLAFARRQNIVPEVLDLNATIGAMMGLLRKLAGESVTIEWRSDASLWPVYIDPSQVDQVLANLVSNARDAIAERGRIEIATRNLPGHPEAGIPDRIELVVRDDGVGMDEDTLAHMFDPFFTTKERGKGTGLGAATVYGIVNQNGGSVRAESAPGNGTTVIIELPRAMSASRSASPAAAVAARRGTETVLVVDDEPAIREMVRRVLERAGYRVLLARDGADALAVSRAHAEAIHLVLSDVIMPGMDGKTLVGLLQDSRPGLKALLMSGYTGDALQFDAEAQQLLLQKPFSNEALLEAVRRALDAA